MRPDRLIVEAIRFAQDLLRQNLPPIHNLTDAAAVLRLRELVHSPSIRSAFVSTDNVVRNVGVTGLHSSPLPHCRRRTAWSDLGERWSSRLVGTAAEDRLSIQRNSFARFLLPIEPLSSWCLISHLQYKFGGNALHNSVFGGEPKCGLPRRRWS
jgi:hypothetical protein